MGAGWLTLPPPIPERVAPAGLLLFLGTYLDVAHTELHIELLLCALSWTSSRFVLNSSVVSSTCYKLHLSTTKLVINILSGLLVTSGH